jgi:hypothetical protein
MNHFGTLPEFTDLRHVSSESNDYESLRDFTWSSWIHAMSPLDLSVQVHFGSSGLRGSEISVLKLKTPLQYSRSSRSVDKCPCANRWLTTLRLFGLWVFQHFDLRLPLDLLTCRHVSSWIQWSRFSPALWLSMLRESQVSNLPPPWTHGI